VEIDREEAILSQMLLRSLDSLEAARTEILLSRHPSPPTPSLTSSDPLYSTKRDSDSDGKSESTITPLTDDGAKSDEKTGAAEGKDADD
jgi:hypothetical protein